MILVGAKAKVGTVGITDNTTDPQLEECEAKKSTEGNQWFKARFGQRRTHNEQTLVQPCSVIFAHAIFYGTEVISNFLVRFFLH